MKLLSRKTYLWVSSPPIVSFLGRGRLYFDQPSPRYCRPLSLPPAPFSSPAQYVSLGPSPPFPVSSRSRQESGGEYGRAGEKYGWVWVAFSLSATQSRHPPFPPCPQLRSLPLLPPPPPPHAAFLADRTCCLLSWKLGGCWRRERRSHAGGGRRGIDDSDPLSPPPKSVSQAKRSLSFARVQYGEEKKWFSGGDLYPFTFST